MVAQELDAIPAVNTDASANQSASRSAGELLASHHSIPRPSTASVERYLPTFVPEKVSGDSGHPHAAVGAPSLGLGAGLTGIRQQWRDSAASRKPFVFREPAADTLVSADTLDNYVGKKPLAIAFMEQQINRLSHSSTAASAERLSNVRAALAETTTSVVPKSPLNLNVFDSDIRKQAGWSSMEELVGAQPKVFVEREAGSAALFDSQMKAHNQGRIGSWANAGTSIAALIGATTTDYYIDKAIPRSQTSPLTMAATIAAPLVFGFEMTPVGKFAPLVKFGIVVGSHALMREFADKK